MKVTNMHKKKIKPRYKEKKQDTFPTTAAPQMLIKTFLTCRYGCQQHHFITFIIFVVTCNTTIYE